MIPFSKARSQLAGNTNALTRALNALRSAGRSIVDLTAATTGERSLAFSEEFLIQAFSTQIRTATRYEPETFGNHRAREAVAQFYRERFVEISPEHILLTPGSSLSYLYLFKLLADSGDEILCPQPSYPLFDVIGNIAGVEMRAYPIREGEVFPHWTIDLEELENRVTTKTRAILIVSPHNPTGMVADVPTLQGIAQITARHNLAVIQDEVFSEFLYPPATLPRAAKTAAPLVFTLNGISKMFALASLKLSWIALSGDATEVEKARVRLEMIADAFLPVNEMVQAVLPLIMNQGEIFLEQLKKSVRARLAQTMEAVSSIMALTPLAPQGGFHLPLRLNDPDAEADKIAVDLLNETGLLIHPGSFYDTKGEHLILCFNQDEAVLKEGLLRLRRYFHAPGPKPK